MELPVARTIPDSLSLPLVAPIAISHVSRVHAIVYYGGNKKYVAKLCSLAPAAELVEGVAERSGMLLERHLVLDVRSFRDLYRDLTGFHLTKNNVASALATYESNYDVFGLSSNTCVSNESIEKIET